MSNSMEYDPKNMTFRRLGNTGLQVPVISLGGWLTYGGTVKGDPVKEILKLAFEAGINYFDTAEGYAKGQSEIDMGRAIKELGIRRSDLIISTKIYFGVGRKGPNDNGLSRKHIIEGLNQSLERLQMDYVDIVFAHRSDPGVPMLEVVRAFNFIIEQGKAHYWATSMWSASEIEEAFFLAEKHNLHAPIAEQCIYNAFDQYKYDEYVPIFKKYNYGTTIFSPLAGGFLTGKYSAGTIPEGSRLAVHQSYDFIKQRADELNQPEGKARIQKVTDMTEIGKAAPEWQGLEPSTAQIALAWAAKHPNTSTMIIGASNPQQLIENLKALPLIPKMTDETYEKISKVFKP